MGGYNTPGYNNSAFDAIVDDMTTAPTEQAMKDKNKEGEAILLEDMPYLQLFTVPVNDIFRGVKQVPFTAVVDGYMGYNGKPSVHQMSFSYKHDQLIP